MEIKYDVNEEKFFDVTTPGIAAYATHKQIKEYYDKILAKHKIQDCTPKQWDHCRVEKMGCGGCYYDHGIHSNTKHPYEVNTLRIPEAGDSIKCLHCGSVIAQIGLGVPIYCEVCYQDILTKYQKDQLKIKKAAEELLKK